MTDGVLETPVNSIVADSIVSTGYAQIAGDLVIDGITTINNSLNVNGNTAANRVLAFGAVLHSQQPEVSFVILSLYTALMFGDITLNTGITVTLEPNSIWRIL